MVQIPDYIAKSIICLITTLKGIVFIEKINLFKKNVAGIIG